MSHQNYPINKITPLSPGKVVLRERLFSLFDQPQPNSAFWISGPGGSGKSTLIASYLAQRNLRCLWYQMDALDADPSNVFYYLGQAALTLMDSKDPPLPLLTQEYFLDIDTFITRYFEQLFQRLDAPCWIIFDNFQEVPEDSPVQKILSRAIEILPQNLTITIASRNDPPPSFARFRANRTISLINWNQLAFNLDESSELIKLSGCSLDEQETEKIFRYTQGWVAGAILWLLHSGNNSVSQPLPTDTAPDSIFDYFASEVLDKADPVIREFLLKTALLPHMTVDMADQLTGLAAADILEELSRRNYFLEKRNTPTPTYQYHPLFRDFLQARASRIFSHEELNKLFSKAAEILCSSGSIEAGVALFIQAKDYEPLAGIIVSHAQSMVLQGRYMMLNSWIDSFPTAIVNSNPWLLFWKGVALMPINPQEGQSNGIKAYELFKQTNHLPGQIISWAMIIETYLYLRATFIPLDRWIFEGERLGELIVDKVDVDTLGRFASSMLFALLFRNPGHPDFSLWQERCEELLAQCRDEQVLVSLRNVLRFCYFWLGQMRRGQVFLSSEPLEGVNKISPSTRIQSNISQCVYLLSTGRLPECRIAAEKTLEFAQEVGIHVHDLLFFSYVVYSGLLQGDLKTAHLFLKRMKKSLMPHALWDSAQYHFIVAWLATLEGDLATAKIQSDICTKQTLACGNPYSMALSQLLESQIVLEGGAPTQAKAVLERINKWKIVHNSRQIDFSLNLVLADCAYAEYRVDDAKRHLALAFNEAEENGLVIPTGLSRSRLATLCAKALKENIQVDTVIEFIKLGRFTPPSASETGEEWPWPVKIYTLGRFDIQLYNELLPLSVKTPRKLLELLRFLICAQGQKSRREFVANRLWPEADGDRTIQSFNTTLHRLRKLLGRDDSVILEKRRVFLNQQCCWIDSWHFDELVTLAETAVDWNQREKITQKALALYRGAFDMGQGYIPTITGYSEQLRDKWGSLIGDFCRDMAKANKPKQALDLLKEALSQDNRIEYLHQVLITILIDQGRTNDARMAFEHCSAVLKEMGMVPSKNTLALSDELRRS